MRVRREIQDTNYLKVHLGRFRFFFYRQYDLVSLINDVLIGLAFVAGSILNFMDSMVTFGNILYLLGSLFLLARPLLKIIHNSTLSGLNDNKKQKTYKLKR